LGVYIFRQLNERDQQAIFRMISSMAGTKSADNDA